MDARLLFCVLMRQSLRCCFDQSWLLKRCAGSLLPQVITLCGGGVTQFRDPRRIGDDLKQESGFCSRGSSR